MDDVRLLKRLKELFNHSGWSRFTTSCALGGTSWTTVTLCQPKPGPPTGPPRANKSQSGFISSWPPRVTLVMLMMSRYSRWLRAESICVLCYGDLWWKKWLGRNHGTWPSLTIRWLEMKTGFSNDNSCKIPQTKGELPGRVDPGTSLGQTNSICWS